MTGGALRPALLDALCAALAALDPTALVASALPPLPPKRARVRVIAVGKAAGAMARGALDRWTDRVDDVLVVTVDDAPAGPPDPRVVVRRAGHPLPDDRSSVAAEDALARASSLGASDLLLALVSGGASALLACPPAGMSLADARAIVAALLDRGAPIADVNTVRRHLSRVSGGRLAAAAAPARALTLLIGDVIDGAPHDIGSGPTVADPTTCADAEGVLLRWLADRADLLALARSHLDESLKPGASGSRLRARIVADPFALADAVAASIARRGLRATVLPPEQGDAAAIVLRRLEQARRLAPGEAVVIACEPTLALTASRGRGGRAGWIALAAMRSLPPGVTLLCAASDGVDGSSGAGGAIVTREDAARIEGAAIDEALACFDDAPLHARLGTAIAGGPTGTNLTDVHVVAREP